MMAVKTSPIAFSMHERSLEPNILKYSRGDDQGMILWSQTRQSLTRSSAA